MFKLKTKKKLHGFSRNFTNLKFVHDPFSYQNVNVFSFILFYFIFFF